MTSWVENHVDTWSCFSDTSWCTDFGLYILAEIYLVCEAAALLSVCNVVMLLGSIKTPVQKIRRHSASHPAWWWCRVFRCDTRDFWWSLMCSPMTPHLLLLQILCGYSSGQGSCQQGRLQRPRPQTQSQARGQGQVRGEVSLCSIVCVCVCRPPGPACPWPTPPLCFCRYKTGKNKWFFQKLRF